MEVRIGVVCVLLFYHEIQPHSQALSSCCPLEDENFEFC